MPTATKFRVLITDYAWDSLDIERNILNEINAEIVVANHPHEPSDEQQLLHLAPSVDAILTCWQNIPPTLLDVAPRCKIVSRYGIGLDNIPVAHATSLGILVTNVPDFCLEEVSDHTLALLLACARRIVAFARATRNGVWDLSAGQSMARLRGQTLGLIGYGNIARTLAAKAHALGLQVIAHTPRIPPDALAPWGSATTDLDFLLQSSDYVSLHLPLTQETQHLIDARALRLMKPSAYLLNTSRGAIVDEAALYQAICKGEISGAALDVLDTEPPDPANPLLTHENVIVTPHAAFYSETAIAELARAAATHVVQALSGYIPDNVVNPAVIQSPNFRLNAGGLP